MPIIRILVGPVIDISNVNLQNINANGKTYTYKNNKKEIFFPVNIRVGNRIFGKFYKTDRI